MADVKSYAIGLGGEANRKVQAFLEIYKPDGGTWDKQLLRELHKTSEKQDAEYDLDRANATRQVYLQDVFGPINCHQLKDAENLLLSRIQKK